MFKNARPSGDCHQSSGGRARFTTRLQSLALIAVIVGTGAACVGTGPQLNEGSERRVQYTCEDGKTLEMRYSPGPGPATLTRDGRAIELVQQPDGLEMHYSNGQITVRGRDSDLRLEIGRRAPIACRAQG